MAQFMPTVWTKLISTAPSHDQQSRFKLTINYIVTIVVKDAPGALSLLCRTFSQKNPYPLWPWLESLFCPDRTSVLWSLLPSPCRISTAFDEKRHFLPGGLTKNNPPLLITTDSMLLSIQHCETFPRVGWERGSGGQENLARVHRHYPFVSSWMFHVDYIHKL